MDEFEELRKKKMQELQGYNAMQQNQQFQEQLALQQQAEQLKAQLKIIMSQILTPEARGRISNIRAAKPDFAMQIELYLAQLYQAGRIRTPLTDKELAGILSQFAQKRETKIIRK